MYGPKIFFAAIFLLLLTGLMFTGCDDLVTENNTVTLIDSTLGMECFDCHNDSDNPFLRPKGQFDNSQHAASARLIDASVIIDGASFNVSSCGASCHTHEGFLAEFDSLSIGTVGYSAISCFTCHMPHTGTYQDWDPDTLRALYSTVELTNGAYLKMGKSTQCVHCHQAKSAPDIISSTAIEAGWGTHYSPQTDVLSGTGGFFVDFNSDDNDHMGDTVTGGCFDCHYGNTDEVTGQGYEFGEHSFRLQRIEGSDTTYFVDNCKGSGCHDGSSAADITGFYDFELIDSIRSKTGQLETVLKDADILDDTDPDGLTLRADTTIKPEEARILYNYLMVRHDGTEGVHNPLFVSEILDSSLTRWDSIPRADFYFTQTVFCVPVTIDITDTSSGSISEYSWNFGDGTITSDFGSTSHIYTDPGNYQIMLVVSGTGGQDTAVSGTVPVYDVPVANFTSAGTIHKTGETVDSVAVDFSNASYGGATSYSWNFGDGGVDISENPHYSYETPDPTYAVTLSITNPCGTDDTTITIYTYEPTADFESNVTTVAVGTPVYFTDLSTGAMTWEWDFGDSETSTEQNPSHSYETAGSYTVSLVVTNTVGTDTLEVADMITVE